ncbi:hypothetical protein A33M_0465 [Rhodovulum sp. PH10]|nr:hypothetical protein A33M_0465 [Rhodovulum sp. PH10]
MGGVSDRPRRVQRHVSHLVEPIQWRRQADTDPFDRRRRWGVPEVPDGHDSLPCARRSGALYGLGFYV